MMCACTRRHALQLHGECAVSLCCSSCRRSMWLKRKALGRLLLAWAESAPFHSVSSWQLRCLYQASTCLISHLQSTSAAAGLRSYSCDCCPLPAAEHFVDSPRWPQPILENIQCRQTSLQCSFTGLKWSASLLKNICHPFRWLWDPHMSALCCRRGDRPPCSQAGGGVSAAAVPPGTQCLEGSSSSWAGG